MKYNLTILLAISCQAIFAQNTILELWERIPNSKPSTEKEVRDQGEILWVRNVQVPTIEVYLPVKRNATGMALVICPGGGYGGLAYDWEGVDVAKWLNSKGIAGIVLKYRLPGSTSVETGHLAPVQDAQRALRLVRENASEWNIDPEKIGIMGFSAGGHLASTLATQYNRKVYDPMDEIDSHSARPDFQVLIYPVITMAEVTHGGSRTNLIGEDPPDEMKDMYSGELNVKKNDPPAWILHSTDDGAVPVENSLMYYHSVRRAGIPVEMHIFPTGGHGYGLAVGRGSLAEWPGILYRWLSELK